MRAGGGRRCRPDAGATGCSYAAEGVGMPYRLGEGGIARIRQLDYHLSQGCSSSMRTGHPHCCWKGMGPCSVLMLCHRGVRRVDVRVFGDPVARQVHCGTACRCAQNSGDRALTVPGRVGSRDRRCRVPAGERAVCARPFRLPQVSAGGAGSSTRWCFRARGRACLRRGLSGLLWGSNRWLCGTVNKWAQRGSSDIWVGDIASTVRGGFQVGSEARV